MGMEYDELLSQYLGEFGKYQKLIMVAVCLLSMPLVLNNMGIVFLAAVPEHHCSTPSAAHLHLPTDELLRLTAPPDKQKCFTYDRDYSNWTIAQVGTVLNGTVQNNVSVIPCQHGWEYDKSTYQSTIVTEWDLVCDKKALVPTAASIYMAGLMAGAILFGFISDVLGRRVSFIACSVVMVTFGVAFPFSPNYMVFYALRFILAMATMGLFTSVFIIGIEVVGPSYRGFAGMVVWYFWAAGYLIIAGVAYGLRDWKYLGLALAAPQALVLILIFFMPESPRWLYSMNKHTQGDVIIRKMAKVNGVTVPDKIDVVAKKGPKAYVWDLFRYPKLRLRTLNIFFNWFVNSIVYYGLSLNTSNLGGNNYVSFFISGAVEFPACFFCQLSLHYIGRRWTLAGTMVVGGVSLLSILAVPQDLSVVTSVLAMIGKFCITGSFNLIYVYSAELFPTVVRNVGVGSGSFWARFGATIAPYIGSLSDVSVFIPYITFGTMSIVAGLLALLLPETRGHQLPESMEDGENFPHHITTKTPEGMEADVKVHLVDSIDPGVKTFTTC